MTDRETAAELLHGSNSDYGATCTSRTVKSISCKLALRCEELQGTKRCRWQPAKAPTTPPPSLFQMPLQLLKTSARQILLLQRRAEDTQERLYLRHRLCTFHSVDSTLTQHHDTL